MGCVRTRRSHKDTGVEMKHSRAAAFLVVLAAAGPVLAVAANAPAARGDPGKAQPIVNSVCATCHGADGNSPLPANPSLAGQHASYLYKQLSDYKAGRRKNAFMNSMVAGLSDDDLRNLAAYFATQKHRPDAAKDRDLASAGQKLYRGGDKDTGAPACSGCHFPDGAG